MFPVQNRLKTLKVRDVMCCDVVEVAASQSMSEAAKAFAASHVNSAPVIDEQGKCIGMLSAADFVARDCPAGGYDLGSEGADRHSLRQSNPDEPFVLERNSDTVAEYMTKTVQSVAANEWLLRAARMMCAEHLHHLPVLDAERPVGVISTMDVVAALITAIDEAEL